MPFKQTLCKHIQQHLSSSLLVKGWVGACVRVFLHAFVRVCSSATLCIVASAAAANGGAHCKPAFPDHCFVNVYAAGGLWQASVARWQDAKGG